MDLFWLRPLYRILTAPIDESTSYWIQIFDLASIDKAADFWYADTREYRFDVNLVTYSTFARA